MEESERAISRDLAFIPVRIATADIPPTARRLLNAGKGLLATKGYQSITLSAVAAKAGVSNKAATRYYFGNKDGLIAAVFEDLVIDAAERLVDDVVPSISPQASTEERVDAYIGLLRSKMLKTRRSTAYFEILPHAVRERTLRGRLRYWYEFWYSISLRLLLPAESDVKLPEQVAEGIGHIAGALADGLMIHSLVFGADDSQEATLAATRHLLLAGLSQTAPRSGERATVN
jgi:AcrR family transcriptional regulator